MFKARSQPPLMLICAAFVTLVSGCRDPSGIGGQGEDIKQLSCMVTNDFYAVRFTAYQASASPAYQDNAAFTPYCQELPASGRTYMTVDLLDQDLRTTAIAVRIAEDTASGPKTLAEVPGKTYPAGVVELSADLPRPGQYSVTLAVGRARAAENTIKIPLKVHVASPLEAAIPYAAFFILGIGGVMLWRYAAKRRAPEHA